MLAIKGRLKVAFLFVGVLVTGLAMCAGFQVQKAEAHVPQCDVTIPAFILNAIEAIPSGVSTGNPPPPTPVTASYSHQKRITYSQLQKIVNGRKTTGYTCDFCGGDAYISEVLRRTEYWKHEKVYHVFSATGLGANLADEFCHQHDTMTNAVQMWELAGKNCYTDNCGG